MNDFEQVTSSYYSTENNEEKIGPHSFSIISLIGKGSFGEVYLVEKTISKAHYAMKVLHKQKIISKKIIQKSIFKLNFRKQSCEICSD